MFRFLYYFLWYCKIKFLKKKLPLQSVLFINSICNLQCKHCCIIHSDDYIPISKSYDIIKKEIEDCYKMGSRFLDLEGGEPTLWKDKDNTLDDIVCYAKNLGFHQVTITTNGTNKISTMADMVWVSLDGLYDIHNLNRGVNSFEKLIDNINSSDHKNINVNMTISNINKHQVKDTILFVKGHKKIKSIALNFYTPVNEKQDSELYVNNIEKIKIIDQIIELNKKNYPIMNSISGLKSMRRHFENYNTDNKNNNNLGEKCFITNFIMPNSEYFKQCQGKEKNLCKKCGLAMKGEMESLLNLDLEMILQALKVRL